MEQVSGRGEGHSHHGISCTVNRPHLCAAIEAVLARIYSQFPQDLSLIRERVQRFALVPHWARQDSLGRWVRSRRDPVGNAINPMIFATAGIVDLHEECSAEEAPFLAAHELGHACTRSDDFERRLRVPGPEDWEWTAELCAQYYAYKWGFEALADSSTRELIPSHYYISKPEGDGSVWVFWVTRRFFRHYVARGSVGADLFQSAVAFPRPYYRIAMHELLGLVTQKRWRRQGKRWPRFTTVVADDPGGLAPADLQSPEFFPSPIPSAAQQEVAGASAPSPDSRESRAERSGLTPRRSSRYSALVTFGAILVLLRLASPAGQEFLNKAGELLSSVMSRVASGVAALVR